MPILAEARQAASPGPRLRRVAVVATCRRSDMHAALRDLVPGAEPLLVDEADRRTGISGAAAALVELPADAVSGFAARVRGRLRHATTARSILVGVSVDDADNDAQLLRLAADALVSGHGVASDHAVIRARLRRATRRTGLRGLIRRWYDASSPSLRRWQLVALTTAMGLLIPFAVYSVLWAALGVDVAPTLFWVVFGVLGLTAASIYAEILYAVEPPALPEADSPRMRASDPLVTGVWPKVSLLVAAYLPNELEVLPETVEQLLSLRYPGEVEVVVAGNGDGPGVPELLQSLRKRVVRDHRLRVVVHPGSRSKAENVNAGLDAVTGAIVGVLDADHHLAPNSLVRAARWVAGGYADVVQGHNVVRNGDTSQLASIVAVEFEGIYAVAHPGRARLHGFGIFGGSNGFWRADLLDRLRMRPWMLTEDIDVSTRAVLEGATIVSDRWLVSRELAPETLSALWSQRIRWSQGWAQVSRAYLARCPRSRTLTRRQRMGYGVMFGLREAYPWIAPQMFPLLAFQLLVRHTQHLHWILPPFVLATIVVTSVGPLQALAAWRFAAPDLREHRGWFLSYLVKTGALYGEWKAVANRCAHVRQWIGDDAWTVTPRSKSSPILVAAENGAAEADTERSLLDVHDAPPAAPVAQPLLRLVADRAPEDDDAPSLPLPTLTYADGSGFVRTSPLFRVPRRGHVPAARPAAPAHAPAARVSTRPGAGGRPRSSSPDAVSALRRRGVA